MEKAGAYYLFTHTDALILVYIRIKHFNVDANILAHIAKPQKGVFEGFCHKIFVNPRNTYTNFAI